MKRTGALLATAVAGLFLAGHVVASDTAKTTNTAKIKCAGGNSCKGKSGCHSAENSCKGQNGCKGKGWTEVDSEKTCTDTGGKVSK